MIRRRSFQAELRKVLEARESRNTPMKPVRVLGRNRDGSELHQRLDGTCPQRGEGNNDVGQVVVLPTAPIATRRSLGLPTIVTAGGIMARLIRQNPRALLRGQTNIVLVDTRGEVTRPQMQYLIEGETPYPGLTVDFVNPLPNNQLQVHISVAADAPLRRNCPVAYSTTGGHDAHAAPTALPLRENEFFDVVPPDGGPRWMALHRTEAGLITPVKYTRSGLPLGPAHPGMQLAMSPERGPWTFPLGLNGVGLHPDSLVWIDDNGALHITDWSTRQTLSYPSSGGVVVGAWHRVDGLFFVAEWQGPHEGALETAISLYQISPTFDSGTREIVFASTLPNLQGGEYDWLEVTAAGLNMTHLSVIAIYDDGGELVQAVNGVWDMTGARQTGFATIPGPRGIALHAQTNDKAGASRGAWVWEGGVGGEGGGLGGWRPNFLGPLENDGASTLTYRAANQWRTGGNLVAIDGDPFAGGPREVVLQEEPGIGPIWTLYLIGGI